LIIATGTGEDQSAQKLGHYLVSLIRRMVFTAMYLETSNMIASNCQSRIFFKAGLRCRLTMRNGTTSERRPVSQSVRIFCNAR
ncbi:hypothetical protein, partial [Bifidobacterium longum]|uniref:hypothetical protein n=1 Tax=Bifidobacterium longum TaxID=216816 RepID=UPI001C706E7A